MFLKLNLNLLLLIYSFYTNYYQLIECSLTKYDYKFISVESEDLLDNILRKRRCMGKEGEGGDVTPWKTGGGEVPLPRRIKSTKRETRHILYL